jgi:diguanylate cyclase (GGDEF)-like protein
LVIAVALVVSSVWVTATRVRATIDNGNRATEATVGLLVSMLQQRDAAQSFFLTGRESYLEPYVGSRREFQERVAAVRASIKRGDQHEAAELNKGIASAQRWVALTDRQIAAVRAGGTKAHSLRAAARRNALFTTFEQQITHLRIDVALERDGNLRRLALQAVGAILAICAGLAALGFFLLARDDRLANRRREEEEREQMLRSDFTQAMQFTRTESAAHQLLKRHLERILPETRVVILNRNNSADRLESATSLSDDAVLAEKLGSAHPDDCLAIQLGRTHEQNGEDESLLQCQLCRRSESRTTCIPSLVGSEVIGSVNLHHQTPLDERQKARVSESVTQAAPVLANLRNLALAETRAATDALTGLPNSRSVADTLKRMIAQTQRMGTPLAAVLVDLDHFKQINDTYGHGKGDEALAAVADTLAAGIRGSDFAGRYGGEEFLLLLPNTGREGALALAENLRASVARLHVPGIRRLSASFGVAVAPEDANGFDSLLRASDRALYRAKSAGRNRVDTIIVEELSDVVAGIA